MRAAVLALCLAICAGAGVALGQGAGPRFTVASVRVAPPQAQSSGMIVPVGTRWRVNAVNLAFILRVGFGLCDEQIAGGPKWIHSDSVRFSIDAETPAPPPDESTFRQMVRSLLETRFGLKTHWASKSLPSYSLELTGGHARLPAATGSCVPPGSQLPGASAEGRVCGRLYRTLDHDGITWHVTARSITTAQMAEQLGRTSALPVVDLAKVGAPFDVDITYKVLRLGNASDRSAGTFAMERAFRSIGLALDLTHAVARPVPTLVVDHVSMPTPN